MTEVRFPDGKIHETYKRAHLVELAKDYAASEAWYGIEQEYTFFRGRNPLGPLDVADQLWLARWLLYRTAEDFGVNAMLHPKPVKGDWNGAGAHTNFSTREMRDDGGFAVIEDACKKLGEKHKELIAVYGADNDQRLTGLHETCSIHEFRYGVSDRGASIRIPRRTVKQGKGYLEDRRPSANMDPYEVCAILLETVCS